MRGGARRRPDRDHVLRRVARAARGGGDRGVAHRPGARRPRRRRGGEAADVLADRLRADLGDRHRPHRHPGDRPGGVRARARRRRRDARRRGRCACSTAAASRPRRRPSCCGSPTSTAPWWAARASTRTPSPPSSAQPEPARARARSSWSSSTGSASRPPAPATPSAWRARPRSTASPPRAPAPASTPPACPSACRTGQQGNSEVGHLNLGAGRRVPQMLVRIDEAIADGSLARNPALQAALDARPRAHPAPAEPGRRRAASTPARRTCWRSSGSPATPGVERIVVHAHDRRPRHAARHGARRRGGDRGHRRPRRHRRAAATGRWTATAAGTAPAGRTTRSSTARASHRATRRRGRPRLVRRRRHRRVHRPGGDRRRRGHAASATATPLIYVNFRPDRARQLTQAFSDPAFDGFDRGPDAGRARHDDDDPLQGRVHARRSSSSRRTCARGSPR